MTRWIVHVYGPDDLLYTDAPLTLTQAVHAAHAYNTAMLGMYTDDDEGTPLCWAVPEPAPEPPKTEVVDLVAALRASVEAAKARRITRGIR